MKAPPTCPTLEEIIRTRLAKDPTLSRLELLEGLGLRGDAARQGELARVLADLGITHQSTMDTGT